MSYVNEREEVLIPLTEVDKLVKVTWSFCALNLSPRHPISYMGAQPAIAILGCVKLGSALDKSR